jgi:probable DNA metabolism protein
MITYIYDGTFPGLLTAVYLWFNNHQTVADIATASRCAPDLFTEMETVTTDPQLAGKLLQALAGKLTRSAFHDLYFCFLSEVAGIEKSIGDYLQKILKYGGSFAQNYADDTARLIRKTSDRVSYEIHRYHGFVRFRKMNDGLYYAPIEPDSNIVELLAPHFSARFADQPWFIHDLRRSKGLYYDGGRTGERAQCRLVTGVEARPEAVLSVRQIGMHGVDFNPGIFEADEPLYQELWNEYFKGIAIRERENKRLQRQHMPKRYWAHMTERVEI